MSGRGFSFLLLITALGCGLMAGVFFAFSSFVMKGLGHLPVAEGIAAMQEINRTVMGSVFLTTFLGTALACLIVLGSQLTRWNQPGTVWLLAGCAFYLVGTFLVTVVWNVPLNNGLDGMQPYQADAGRIWAEYQAKWGVGNHIRTITSLLALLCLIMGLSGVAGRGLFPPTAVIPE